MILGLSAPYLVADARGFVLDFVLHGVSRDADSTALAFFLPPWGALALSASGALLAAILLGTIVRSGWTTERRIRWLVASHVIALATAGNLHNNYLVWLQPVLGILVAFRLARRFGASQRASS